MGPDGIPRAMSKPAADAAQARNQAMIAAGRGPPPKPSVAGPSPYTQEAPMPQNYGGMTPETWMKLQPEARQQAAQPVQQQPSMPAGQPVPGQDERMEAWFAQQNPGAATVGYGPASVGHGQGHRVYGPGSTTADLKSEMTLANIFAINSMHILGDGIFAKSPEVVGFACATMYLKSR